MDTRRRKSVPPPRSQPISSSSGSTLSELSRGSTPPSLSKNLIQPPAAAAAGAATSANSNKMLSRADALAKITFELNIRTVEGQVKGLEKIVKDLVEATADDKEFRAENETKLSKLWQEMVAVQQQASRVEGQQKVTSDEFDAMQRETKDLVDSFREEVKEVRESLCEISQLIAELSKTGEDNANRDSGYSSLNYELDLGADLAPTQPIDHTTEQQQQQQQNTDYPGLIKEEPQKSRHATTSRTEARIKAGIGSTKRWHRDHKTTKLTESVFCANYLKQQSKRDVELAVFLQKCIGKRIRKRVGRSHSKPRSIEEFCRDVTWRDVLDTVQETLVDHPQLVAREIGG